MLDTKTFAVKDYDPEVYKQYFLPDGQALSLRWEFTIPFSAKGGGELYLRAVHFTPDQAIQRDLKDNVLAVALGDPIPVYTLGAVPDFNMGFMPPLLPSVCTDTPIDQTEYRDVCKIENKKYM